MSTHNIGYQFASVVIEWLDTVIYGLGLVVGIWGFLRSRKWGYFVFALYFAWGIVAPLVVPVLAPLFGGHPVRPTSFPYGIYGIPAELIAIHPEALIAVLGTWLLVRREP